MLWCSIDSHWSYTLSQLPSRLIGYLSHPVVLLVISVTQPSYWLSQSPSRLIGYLSHSVVLLAISVTQPSYWLSQWPNCLIGYLSQPIVLFANLYSSCLIEYLEHPCVWLATSDTHMFDWLPPTITCLIGNLCFISSCRQLFAWLFQPPTYYQCQQISNFITNPSNHISPDNKLSKSYTKSAITLAAFISCATHMQSHVGITCNFWPIAQVLKLQNKHSTTLTTRLYPSFENLATLAQLCYTV